MFWTIAAVIAALVMLYLMEKYTSGPDLDPDPVFQSVLAIDHLCSEIARWETNLWSLWVMALIENLLFRLDKPERIAYLNKIEDQIIELQRDLYQSQSMSDENVIFETKPNDLHTH